MPALGISLDGDAVVGDAGASGAVGCSASLLFEVLPSEGCRLCASVAASWLLASVVSIASMSPGGKVS